MVDVPVAQPPAPDFNVAPTKEVYAVLERPARTEAGVDHPATRQLRVLTWGLVPSWAKDRSIASHMINARSETAAQKPAFRKAYRARRCLLPADGYYEWYATSATDARGRSVKQPYFIRPHDDGLLAMAGLFEIWRDPDVPSDDPGRFRWTCTVLTTTSTDDLGHIHDRMPMTVRRQDRDAWLDPTFGDPAGIASLLIPAGDVGLSATPVSRAVNDVRNNGAHLVEPIPLEQSPSDAAPGAGEIT